MTLSERLNLTNDGKDVMDRAVKLDGRKDINYFDTLSLYCAENNVCLEEIDDVDFEYCAESIKNFAKMSMSEGLEMYFWLDKF